MADVEIDLDKLASWAKRKIKKAGVEDTENYADVLRLIQLVLKRLIGVEKQIEELKAQAVVESKPKTTVH